MQLEKKLLQHSETRQNLLELKNIMNLNAMRTVNPTHGRIYFLRYAGIDFIYANLIHCMQTVIGVMCLF